MRVCALRTILGLLLLFSSLVSAQETQTCEAGERLFEHEFLEGEPVCIPENPQRVVALEMAGAELTLFTDKVLVGTNSWVKQELPVLMPELADEFANVEIYGYPADLEAVLLAKPDIILAAPGDIDVAAASEIAPVVVAKGIVGDDWEAAFSIWSEVLNIPDVYAALNENYQARIAELQDELGAARETTEVSAVSVSTYGIWLWYEDSAPGNVLEDVGLARPPSQAYKSAAAPEVEISDERLDLVDGDDIFYFSYVSDDPEVLGKENAVIEGLEENPLWQGLGGVKSGHAYNVGGHWWRAQTYLLANRVIDDLFEYLVGAPSETPALSLAGVSQ